MPLVLITGATGFIGFSVLVKTLEAGHSVRAAIRLASQEEEIKSHPLVAPHAAKLSFVLVPRFDIPGTYDEAAEGVTHIIHMAAPHQRPTADPDKDIYEPMLNNMKSLLDTALASPTLQKFVFTASGLTIIPFPPPMEAFKVHAEDRIPDIPGPYPIAIAAYWAGKINSYNYTRALLDRKKPKWECAWIISGYVFGHDHRAKTVEKLMESTNEDLLSYLTGCKEDRPGPTGFSDIDDVAEVHVAALRPGIEGGLVCAKNAVWDDTWAVVEKQYPKAVRSGVLKQAKRTSVPTEFDSDATEKALGMKFKPFEEAVIDAAGQYFDLKGVPRA